MWKHVEFEDYINTKIMDRISFKTLSLKVQKNAKFNSRIENLWNLPKILNNNNSLIISKKFYIYVQEYLNWGL